MNVLAFSLPYGSGLTSPVTPLPELPVLEDAKEFYLGKTKSFRSRAKLSRGHSFHTVQSVAVYDMVDVLAGELSRLESLKPGWDGDHASPISSRASYGAAVVLSRLLDLDSELPDFSPLPSGGIHLEWVANGDEIEIEIDNTGTASVFAESSAGDVVADGVFDPIRDVDFFDKIAVFLAGISARVAAVSHRD